MSICIIRTHEVRIENSFFLRWRCIPTLTSTITRGYYALFMLVMPIWRETRLLDWVGVGVVILIASAYTWTCIRALLPRTALVTVRPFVTPEVVVRPMRPAASLGKKGCLFEDSNQLTVNQSFMCTGGTTYLDVEWVTLPSIFFSRGVVAEPMSVRVCNNKWYSFLAYAWSVPHSWRRAAMVDTLYHRTAWFWRRLTIMSPMDNLPSSVMIMQANKSSFEKMEKTNQRSKQTELRLPLQGTGLFFGFAADPQRSRMLQLHLWTWCWGFDILAVFVVFWGEFFWGWFIGRYGLQSERRRGVDYKLRRVHGGCARLGFHLGAPGRRRSFGFKVIFSCVSPGVFLIYVIASETGRCWEFTYSWIRSILKTNHHFS